MRETQRNLFKLIVMEDRGTSEQRIRLGVLRFSLRHEESSKTPEFSAEWIVNKGKQAVQKLREAVHSKGKQCRQLQEQFGRIKSHSV
jgi:hypothetical protein